MAGKRYFLEASAVILISALPEVCSAHPTSGGPYFWAAMLSPPEYAAFASWITGWFNLLGQVAVTTGIRSVCSTGQFLSNLRELMRTRCAPFMQFCSCNLHLNRRDIRNRFRTYSQNQYRCLRWCSHITRLVAVARPVL